MLILGIDPGLTGAVGVLDDDGRYVEVFDLPVMANGRKAKVKHQLNAAALAKTLRCRIFQGGGTMQVMMACMEWVSGRPDQGVGTMFSLGDTFGSIRGVLAALEIPLVIVTPQVWKKTFGLLGADKNASRTKAIHLYPQAPLELKQHHGRAESLLIARWSCEQVTVRKESRDEP